MYEYKWGSHLSTNQINGHKNPLEFQLSSSVLKSQTGLSMCRRVLSHWKNVCCNTVFNIEFRETRVIASTTRQDYRLYRPVCSVAPLGLTALQKMCSTTAFQPALKWYFNYPISRICSTFALKMHPPVKRITRMSFSKQVMFSFEKNVRLNCFVFSHKLFMHVV